MKFFTGLLLCALASAQVHPLQQLVEKSRGGSGAPGLADMATKTL